MNRRACVTLLGGAATSAVAWPLAARAQQTPQPLIGFLSTRARDESAHLNEAFARGLAETGYSEGRNVTIEYRWANGAYEQLPALAAELVQRPLTLLVASGGQPAALAAKAATGTIPIVAAFSADPVGAGLVASLGRPGGNLTGVSNLSTILEPKRLSLLREVVGAVDSFGVLVNPSFPPSAEQLKDVEAAAQVIGQPMQVLRASTDGELEAAFRTIAERHIGALLVGSDAFFNVRRDKLAELAQRTRVPAMYGFRDYVAAGGLMSYGVDLSDIYRQMGLYAGRVLKGAKPAELPVQQPIKFEFVLNVKTAKAIGVKFSDDLLSLADEVIE